MFYPPVGGIIPPAPVFIEVLILIKEIKECFLHPKGFCTLYPIHSHVLFYIHHLTKSNIVDLVCVRKYTKGEG